MELEPQYVFTPVSYYILDMPAITAYKASLKHACESDVYVKSPLPQYPPFNLKYKHTFHVRLCSYMYHHTPVIYMLIYIGHMHTLYLHSLE